MNVRLFDWQVERLKSGKVSGAAVLRYAVRRYNRGDFGNSSGVVRNIKQEEISAKSTTLESYAVKHRFGLPDHLLRQILTWHFDTPDEHMAAEKAQLDAEIAGILKCYTGKAYITEVQE